MKGTVKWFNNVRGFGFITDETGKDVFVHYSSIEGEGFKKLSQGMPVEFETGSGSDGRPVAVNVRKI